MTNLDILKEVKLELDRFTKKLNLAIKEQEQSESWHNKNFASAKRGAMDLKNELPKLTQSSKYKYQ
jgi:hypothetical protein